MLANSITKNILAKITTQKTNDAMTAAAQVAEHGDEKQTEKSAADLYLENGGKSVASHAWRNEHHAQIRNRPRQT
jgi:hypothetical protein